MRARLIAGLTVVSLAAVVSIAATRLPSQDESSGGLWQVGQCYRVFPSERDTLYIFKVVERPVGPWVRVQAAPTSPPIPGAKPQVRQWLNSGSLFMVQEWSCE